MTISEASRLSASAVDEWEGLVTTAIVGTDRRSSPVPAAGWDTWATAPDHAVALLDRALAVVLALRAGSCPAPVPSQALAPAPRDTRPPCPPACAIRLQRLLGGEHNVLLAEWFERCDRIGAQLPPESLPFLLLRGRREPGLDRVVRRLAAGRAEWLAEVIPELGVSRDPARPAARPAARPTARPGAGQASGGAPVAADAELARPAPKADGGAAVTAVVQLFLDGQATWASAPQLRQVVAGLDPAWLPTLVVELSRLPFRAAAERTRAELLSLAEFRSAMLTEFTHPGTHADIRSESDRP